MAISVNTLPYGLRDVKLKQLADDGTVGAMVDLPAARTLSFSEAEDFETLRGDDQIIAIRGKGANVEWSLESGGISLDAYKILDGGTVTLTGTTPNQIRLFRKTAFDVRPYFKAEGQAISDSGGDFHGILYKARASDNVEGELSDGSFWLTKAGGMAIPNTLGYIYDFVQNETTTAIASG